MWWKKVWAVPRSARRCLAAGEPQDAYAQISELVEYPHKLSHDGDWARYLLLFAEIATALEASEAAEAARSAAGRLRDPEALYALGYALVEEKLHGFAASVLFRALEHAPASIEVVTELSCALEGVRKNGTAAQMLLGSGFLDDHWICRYLYAFNSVLSGELDAARSVLASLDTEDADIADGHGRIDGMLKRAELCPPQDDEDLRGWDFAINGSILLHRSPYGRDAGMGGRYAWLQESADLWRMGLDRLRTTLEQLDVRIDKVYCPSDRNSQVLGHAASVLFEAQLSTWNDASPPEAPGLIVVYNLQEVDPAVFASLLEGRPGQILFVHVTDWTLDIPVAADFTTLHAQSIVSPFEEHLELDPDSQQVVQRPRREEGPEVLAAEVLDAGASDSEEDAEDHEALQHFVQQIRPALYEPHGLLPKVSRRRPRWAGSPVRSGMFA